MAYCVYCDQSDKKLTDEHIWPDGLGGDFLPNAPWRTEVCSGCNSMSGLFVDGGFIKSWMISAERTNGALEYLQPTGPNAGVLPLNYLGPLPDLPTNDGEVAEYWEGPCGAIIIHIRPADTEDIWSSYAGGNPRLRRKKSGRAYMALTSADPFWITISLNSFVAHFEYAERFLLNMEVPAKWANSVNQPNTSDPIQQADRKVTDAVTQAATNGNTVRMQIIHRVDMDTRFLAKLALALGHNLFDEQFLKTSYAMNLRLAFRQPDLRKRRQLGIRGTPYAQHDVLGGAEEPLAWRGGWFLMLKSHEHGLSLIVLSPLGRSMSIVVCDEPSIVASINRQYRDGQVWLTIPSLGQATGPISLPEYIAHMLDTSPHTELSQLEKLRIDPENLPDCGRNSTS